MDGYSKAARSKITDHWYHHLRGKSRGQGQTEGHADALALLALCGGGPRRRTKTLFIDLGPVET